MKGEHHYQVSVTWQGNVGAGTEDYRAYGRDHRIGAVGKADIAGSADPAFRGDATRWNPEDLLVASLSACHKLWYLHLCATSGISVLAAGHGARWRRSAAGATASREGASPVLYRQLGEFPGGV